MRRAYPSELALFKRHIERPADAHIQCQHMDSDYPLQFESYGAIGLHVFVPSEPSRPVYILAQPVECRRAYDYFKKTEQTPHLTQERKNRLYAMRLLTCVPGPFATRPTVWDGLLTSITELTHRITPQLKEASRLYARNNHDAFLKQQYERYARKRDRLLKLIESQIEECDASFYLASAYLYYLRECATIMFDIRRCDNCLELGMLMFRRKFHTVHVWDRALSYSAAYVAVLKCKHLLTLEAQAEGTDVDETDGDNNHVERIMRLMPTVYYNHLYHNRCSAIQWPRESDISPLVDLHEMILFSRCVRQVAMQHRGDNQDKCLAFAVCLVPPCYGPQTEAYYLCHARHLPSDLVSTIAWLVLTNEFKGFK